MATSSKVTQPCYNWDRLFHIQLHPYVAKNTHLFTHALFSFLPTFLPQSNTRSQCRYIPLDSNFSSIGVIALAADTMTPSKLTCRATSVLVKQFLRVPLMVPLRHTQRWVHLSLLHPHNCPDCHKWSRILLQRPFVLCFNHSYPGSLAISHSILLLLPIFTFPRQSQSYSCS